MLILFLSTECILSGSDQLYIIAKADNCSRTIPDLPNLFYSVSQWDQQNIGFTYVWPHLQCHWLPLLSDRAVVKHGFQKKKKRGIHSYFNSNFKISRWELRLSSDVYSTVDVSLHLYSGCF